jgi:hypothetical protein
MLKREGGISLEQIMSAMGWQKHTIRALLSAGGSLTKKHGLVITSERVGDKRTYSIKARSNCKSLFSRRRIQARRLFSFQSVDFRFDVGLHLLRTVQITGAASLGSPRLVPLVHHLLRGRRQDRIFPAIPFGLCPEAQRPCLA